VTDAAIAAIDVTRVYELGETPVHALRGVSLRIDPGEYAAIVGPSGSGKSTLMHLLGLLDRPTSGVITVGENDATALSDAELSDLRNSAIGFVFQSFQLLPRTTAIDNVALPLLYRGVRKAARRELAADALESVGLGSRLRHRPSQLSGGEQQRVAIARALVGGPKLLLADEPTGNLDSRTGRDVMDILERLNQSSGVAVLLVTHDLDIASRAHRQIVMRDGVVESDSGVPSKGSVQ
jgi:putative ABC transport system ATP-binding protein